MPLIVMSEFASSALLISLFASVTVLPERSNVLANSSALTPPSLIVTTPEATAKLSELNCATPFADVLASLPLIVTVLSVTVVEIPVPPVNVRSESRRLTVSVPVSAAIERSVDMLTVLAAVKRPC